MKQLIEDGEWKPGDKIPSENELCDKFEVSRMTIRQAINNLVEQGYLYRKRGIGTFVQLPKVEKIARNDGIHRRHDFSWDEPK